MSRQSFIMLTGAIDGSLIVSFSLTMHRLYLPQCMLLWQKMPLIALPVP